MLLRTCIPVCPPSILIRMDNEHLIVRVPTLFVLGRGSYPYPPTAAATTINIYFLFFYLERTLGSTISITPLGTAWHPKRQRYHRVTPVLPCLLPIQYPQGVCLLHLLHRKESERKTTRAGENDSRPAAKPKPKPKT